MGWGKRIYKKKINKINRAHCFPNTRWVTEYTLLIPKQHCTYPISWDDNFVWADDPWNWNHSFVCWHFWHISPPYLLRHVHHCLQSSLLSCWRFLAYLKWKSWIHYFHSRGVQCIPQVCRKAHFQPQNGVFVRGLRFKKSTLWVQKVHILGVLHPPNWSWLRACRVGIQ